MRSSIVLIEKFEDIKVLQQYLYMHESHFVEVTNVINVTLRIRMDENLDYYCKNMNFPDVQDMFWSEDMTNKTMLSIIRQLKDSPAIEFPERFESRWDEIKTLTLANLSLNVGP